MSENKTLHIQMCVSGAAETAFCNETALQAAEAVGRAIAESGCIMLDGATTGFPYWAAKGAKQAGGQVVGFSPAISEREHVDWYHLPLDYHDVVIYTGFGYAGRNLILTRAANAVIVGCGRIGTINEFTHAFEDKKPIGVLVGEWETDELVRSILENSHRAEEMKDKIVFEKDPKILVERLVAIVREERLAGGPAADVK